MLEIESLVSILMIFWIKWIVFYDYNFKILTHCSLVMSYGDIDLGQHRLS